MLEPTCINEETPFTIEKVINLSEGTIVVQDTEGRIWSWGSNYYGQCGTGTIDNVLIPTKISGSNEIYIENIVLSGTTNIIQDTEGRIWSWGLNYYYGQCGTGATEGVVLTPTKISGSNEIHIENIILSGATIVIQDTEGRIWSWGYNAGGLCGTGTTDNVLEPTCINEENRFSVEKIISKQYTIIIQDTEGKIWTWGKNDYGQCGNGTQLNIAGITCINEETQFKIERIIYNELNSMYYNNESHSIIIEDTEERIWAWGENKYGECGTGNANIAISPNCISNTTQISLKESNISITNNGVLAINKDNEAYIWTANAKPVKINNIDGVNGKKIKEIGITISGIMALDIEGHIYSISEDLKSASGPGELIIIGTYGTGWTKDFVSISDSKY